MAKTRVRQRVEHLRVLDPVSITYGDTTWEGTFGGCGLLPNGKVMFNMDLTGSDGEKSVFIGRPDEVARLVVRRFPRKGK